MKILFLVNLLALYFISYLLKYFFKLSMFFGALKSIKKTFFKEEKKTKVKKQTQPKSFEEEIEDINLKRFRLNKANIKEMVKENFLNPMMSHHKEFYYQFPISLENYLLWKLQKFSLTSINKKKAEILTDKIKIEQVKMFLQTLPLIKEGR